MPRAFRVLKIGWVGSRSAALDEMTTFFDTVVGLEPVRTEQGLKLYALPDGSKFALFSEEQPDHTHYTTGPVPAFQVDSLNDAVAWLRQNSVEIVDGPNVSPRGPMRWVDFRAPDGAIYQFIEDTSAAEI